jgi:hypothetical protein
MGKKRPRWEDDDWRVQHVSEDIVCKTCAFSYGDPPFADKPEKGNCQKYPYPKNKPHDVYFDGAKCQYYEEKK